jgi:mevalonate kinase
MFGGYGAKAAKGKGKSGGGGGGGCPFASAPGYATEQGRQVRNRP